MAEITFNKDGEIEVHTKPYDKPCECCGGTGKVRYCPVCHGSGSIGETVISDEGKFRYVRSVSCPNGCLGPTATF